MTDVAERLEELRERGLYRRLRLIEGPQGPSVTLDGRPVLLLCSNNYLGLADRAEVREAAAEAALRWGAGAGASRLISGNMEPHRRARAAAGRLQGLRVGAPLRLRLPRQHRRRSPRSPARGEVVFSDELNHASIVDGCRLSRAETFVYRHGDVEHLAWGAAPGAAGAAALIVTDGVFSMDGDVAPLPRAAGAGAAPRRPADGRRGARDRRGRPGRPRLGRRRRASAARSTSSSAPSARRSAPTAPTSAPTREIDRLLVNSARSFIFSTAPPPLGRRRGAGGAGAARSRAGAGRAAAGQRRRRCATPSPPRASSVGRLDDPGRPGPGRRGRSDDGALRAAAGARRLRPGHPAADRARGLLAGCASR